MSPSLRDSYSACRALAKHAGNFYYAFLALPTDQFWAMCALYGFTRLVDDAGDDPQLSLEQRTLALKQWRAHLTQALNGDASGHLVLPALVETVQKYQIPPEYLFSLIDGVELDLKPGRYPNYGGLSHYCYHVAGVVGLCCIHVWGFTDERAKPLAVTLGEAFQCTNILRDLKEDIGLGRCYLPVDEMQPFHYTEDDLRRGIRDDRFRRLMQAQVLRARQKYAAGDELKRYLSPVGVSALETMIKLYRGLLDEIERRDYDVFSSRVRLSRWKKLGFALSGILRRYWPHRTHAS
jgi:phytoene synthase